MQWYAKVPTWLKVMAVLVPPPDAMLPVSKAGLAPVSLVAVWGSASWLIQVIVPPTWTFTGSGEYL